MANAKEILASASKAEESVAIAASEMCKYEIINPGWRKAANMKRNRRNAEE